MTPLTPPIDIRADHLRIVHDVLARYLPDGVRVWVFGSRATWMTKDSSDLDLALEADGDIPAQSLSALETAFEDSELPFAVDIVDTKRIGARFKRIVVEQRVALPENEGLRATHSSRRGPFGVLPPDWECSTLGVACERGGGNIQTGPFGSQLHASDYQPVGIPSIMPQNLGDNRVIADGIARIGNSDASRLRRYLVRKGDIVYSRRGDVEKRALIGPREDGWLCGTGCLRVRLGKNAADPRYASYYLGHPAVRDWIVRHAHGATMPILNTAILSACPFVIPPLSEQLAIAHVLGTLDDKIELNRRMNATLEAMARALFRSWFVDFDPVRAKMEGRDTGLPKDIADLFPDRLVDSDLGEIPASWRVGMLGDLLCQRVERCRASGVTASRPYVPIDCITSRSLSLANAKSGESAKSSLTRFYKGDLLFGAMRPYFHKVCIAPFDGTTRTTVLVLYPKREQDFAFATLLLHHPDTVDFATRHSTGSTIPYAVWEDSLEAMLIAVPPSGVLRRFDKLVRPFLVYIAQSYFESRTVVAIRDALLPKLVSGELRVTGLEPASAHDDRPAPVGMHGA